MLFLSETFFILAWDRQLVIKKTFLCVISAKLTTGVPLVKNHNCFEIFHDKKRVVFKDMFSSTSVFILTHYFIESSDLFADQRKSVNKDLFFKFNLRTYGKFSG